MNNQSPKTIAALILQTDANKRTELLQDIARELQKQHQFHIAKCFKYAASLHDD